MMPRYNDGGEFTHFEHEEDQQNTEFDKSEYKDMDEPDNWDFE